MTEIKSSSTPDPKQLQEFVTKVAEMWEPADDGGSITEQLHRQENLEYGRLQSAALELWRLIREARRLVPRRIRNPRL